MSPVGGVPGPADPEGPGRQPQPLDRLGGRGRHGAQQPDAALQHEPGRGPPRQQRDLRVPRLGRQVAAQLERPAAARVHDLLLGQRQAHAAARRLRRDEPLADLAEQRDPRVASAAAGGGVVEPCAAAHEGAPHVHAGDTARVVDVDRPGHGGALPAGQQARAPLRQGARMQRRVRVRQVERDAAGARLGVERAARADEPGHVGDRVPHPVTGPAPLQVHRLVEIERAGRVQGEERDVAQVRPAVQGRRGRGGLGEGGGRERAGHRELGADPVEPRADLGVGLGGTQSQRSARHTTERTGRTPRFRCGSTM